MIILKEVGPRDGLQNDPRVLSTSTKLSLIERLIAAGLRYIEVTSLVNPKKVPALADAEAVLEALPSVSGVCYSLLIPNAKGMDRLEALQQRCGKPLVQEIAVFTAASDAFTQHNIGQSIADSLTGFQPVIARAKAQGLTVRGYISTVVRCPYTGDITPQAVASVAQQLLALGCDELSLGETLGVATPTQIEAMLQAVLAVIPLHQLALHCHDTHGTALDNIKQAMAMGLRTFDGAVGGLGGCPYAPGAKGNVATEALVDLALEQGFSVDINVQALRDTALWLAAQ